MTTALTFGDFNSFFTSENFEHDHVVCMIDQLDLENICNTFRDDCIERTVIRRSIREQAASRQDFFNGSGSFLKFTDEEMQILNDMNVSLMETANEIRLVISLLTKLQNGVRTFRLHNVTVDIEVQIYGDMAIIDMHPEVIDPDSGEPNEERCNYWTIFHLIKHCENSLEYYF